MSVRGVLRSTWSFLRRYIHGPRMEISRSNVIAAIGLIIICLISLMLRLLPMIGYEVLIRAFDPWFNIREVQFIIENGFGAWFGWYDTTTWFPWGRNMARSAYPGIPFTASLMYFGLQTLGITIDVMTLAVIFPAIMGVFGVIAIYALGVEVSSKEVGLFAAFFMAILPAYTQRTIAGFFDNEAIGIFAILLTLFFFIRALRKGSIASAILGGLSLGYLSASWSVYLYMFQILAIFALVMVLLRRYSRRLLLAYTGTVITGMILAICVPRIGPSWPTSTTGLIPLAIWGLLLLIEFNRAYRLTELSIPDRLSGVSTRIRPYFAYIFGAMCALIVVGLGYLFQSGLFLTLSTGTDQGFLGNLAGKFYTVIDPLIRKEAFLLASVGEHLPSPWATFWFNLSFLVLLMPFGFYIAFQRERETDILLIIFALTALYFTGSMIRLALILAPAAAILGAYGLLMATRPFRPIFWQRPILTRRRRRITPPVGRGFATAAYLFLIVLLLASTITATLAINQMGGPEITPGYRNTNTGEVTYYRDYLEAFSWMQHHTPPGTVFMSWWDYGYWTRETGDRYTVVDNATINKTQIAVVGRTFMETNPVAALENCRRLGVDYVFVHFGLGQSGFSGDEGKWQWMIRIAGEVFGDEVPDETYFWDPNTGSYLEPFFDSVIYNMLWLNASGLAQPPVLNSTGEAGPVPSLDSDPGRTIFSLFEPIYFSEIHLMKIYKCNYTYLDSMMELTGASAFSVHEGVDAVQDLSQIVVGVKNTGLHPFTLDSADIGYWDERRQVYDVDTISSVWLATDTGNLTVVPGETVMLNVRAQPYFKVGTDVNVTINAAGFTPTLSASVTIPVRPPPAYNLSGLSMNSWAYDNGTIYIEVQNTGEGYLEIDEEGQINDEEFSIENAILTGGRLLFTGDILGITIDAEYWDVNLIAGEEVTVLLHYMSFMPTYGGLNVSIPITIQAEPSPPSPSAPIRSSSPSSDSGSVEENRSIQLEQGLYVSVSVLCVESSVFFIFRRYEP